MQVDARPLRLESRLTSAALILALGVAAEGTYASGFVPKQPPKASQTAAQQKISSRLLREIDRARRDGDRIQNDAASGVAIDAKGRALVEIRCDVSEAIRTKLRELRATTVSSLPDYRSILAWVPLARLEELASDKAVYGIRPAPQSTNRQKEPWQ